MSQTCKNEDEENDLKTLRLSISRPNYLKFRKKFWKALIIKLWISYLFVWFSHFHPFKGTGGWIHLRVQAGLGKKLFVFIYVKAIGVKKWCFVISNDLNEFKSLLFTECQDLLLLKSHYNFKFGNLIGSHINFWTKIKIYDISRTRPLILVQNGWNFHQMNKERKQGNKKYFNEILQNSNSMVILVLRWAKMAKIYHFSAHVYARICLKPPIFKISLFHICCEPILKGVNRFASDILNFNFCPKIHERSDQISEIVIAITFKQN